MAVDVSILLVSWNTEAALRACLASIPTSFTEGETYEVLAVDNASRDDSLTVLSAASNTTVIANDSNRGFAPAVNQAYRRARGEYVLLLNSDIVLHPGTLTKLRHYLVERPATTGVSPLYLNPDGSFQQHYVNSPSFPAMLALGTGVKRIGFFRRQLDEFAMVDVDFSKPQPKSSGSCLLLRRSDLPAGPLMDERLPIYWNDLRLAQDLMDAGRQVWTLPEAPVTHARGESCRRLGPAIRQRHLIGSMLEYVRQTRGRGYVWIYSAVATVDHATKVVLRRPVTMQWTDLRAALRGDLGPLPDGDTRDWAVLLLTHEDEATVAAQLGLGRRVLTVISGPTGSPIEQIRPDVWRLTYRPNRSGARRAARTVRAWLDHQAGMRVLSGPGASQSWQRQIGADVIDLRESVGVTQS